MSGEGGFRWSTSALIWSLAILAVSGGFAYYVARPQMLKGHALASTVASERAAMASRFESLEVISKAQKETTALTARVADFDRRIPAESKVGEFLEELARMAQNRDLRPETVQPGEPIHGTDVVALPIAIKVRGTFSGIHGLLQDIEHMPRLTRFDRFDVTADAEQPGNVTAELNLKIFFLPPSDATGARTAGGSEARTG